MPSPWTGLDPEVAALLVEVSESENSELFRISRKPKWPSLFDADSAVSSRSASLSTAEKHLVSVYREEVSSHLLGLARARVLTDRVGSMYFSRVIARKTECGNVHLGRARNDIIGLVRESLDSRVSGHTISVLGTLDSRQATRPADIEALAMAAHRLCPSNKTRSQIAISCICRDEVRTASKILRAILEFGCERERLPYVLTNLALTHTIRKSVHQAFEAYEQAAELKPEWYMTAFSAFACAFVACDVDQTLALGKHVDALAGPDDAAVTSFALSHKRRTQVGRYSFHPETIPMYSRVCDRLGDSSRKIANVLTGA